MSIESIDLDDLLPERVRNVDLYDPMREPVIYDLSDNTSQWGMAPGVEARIESLAQDDQVNLSRYPDIYASKLKAALSKTYSQYLGETPTSQIVVGCGTDDVLDCIVRSVTDEGDLVINPTPSFPMAGYFAKFNGRRVQGIELNQDGSLNVEAIISAQAKLVYLCSPNNPTGLSIELDQILEVLGGTSGFVVVDEAYAEFSNQNCLELLERFPNLIVIRTFSKLHALAGLRIGYGIGNTRVISAVEALRGPYKANIVAIEAAIASLSQIKFQNDVVSQTRQTRDWFILELYKLGLTPIDSDANFVFIPIKSVEGYKAAFDRAEIAIRIFEDLAVYGSGVRITIAPKEILIKVLNVLDSLLRGSAR